MGAAAGAGQLALGAMSLLNANKEASSARDAQNAYMQRFDQAYNQVKGWLDEIKGRGGFDATSRINDLKGLVAEQGRIDMGNAAGAARIAGYQPGDTPGQDALTGAMVNNQRFFANQAMNIKNQALQDEMQGIGALTSAAGILSGNGSMVQNRYNQAQAGVGNAASGLGQIIGNTDWNAFKMGGKRQAAQSNVSVSRPGAGLLGSGGYMNYKPARY